MCTDRLWAVSFALLVGCGASDGGQPMGVAGGSASAGGAGAAQIGGVSGAQAGASSGGGLSMGGTAGSANASGGSGAGTPTSGGTSTGGRANSTGGSAGRGSGGASSGGGAASHAGSGSGGKAAMGGAGSCVQNIGCKLTAPASSGDLHQDCVDRINQFRTQCACLPPLSRSTDGEACADQMAEYDAAKNTAHAGYTDKICKPSGAQNSCPGYSSNNQVISLCLQQMWDEGPPPTNPCDDDCFQEYGHFINMTSTSSTKVACGFYTTSAGKVWAVQNFLR